jgi:hypothetical protein
MTTSNRRGWNIAWGSSRMVILTKRWAIKLPRPTEWRLFLHGLLANMQERQFATTKDPRLCPIKFGVPGGWFIVMPRASALEYDEWDAFDWEAFCAYRDDDEAMMLKVPVEGKWSSFGWLNGKIVAIDYGN